MKPTDASPSDRPPKEHRPPDADIVEVPAADELFTGSLAAYHEALMSGLVWEDPDGTLPEDDADLAEQLAKARRCVQLLHERWPAHKTVTSPANALEGQPVTPPPPVVQGPMRVGRFQIERQLGQGAHGVVFLARDTSLGRNVALKVPRPETLLGAQFRRRFLREAQAASSLNHPNLVTVYETGEIGPVCYIAQEYCPGQTLATWMAERAEPVPTQLAAALVAMLANAVDYAHRRGVLHRDLKPGNVILEPRAEGALPSVPPLASLPFLPKITDFGLAKLIEQDGSDTHSGMLLGTPQYMAPEQAEGRVQDIVPATDVYALGVVLYELLTGRTPFQGLTGIEAIRRIVADDLVPPRCIRHDVPRDLEAICLKCLEKNAAQRYTTASALANDLQRFLAGAPTEARPVRWPQHLYKSIRRRPALAGLLAVSVAATLALSIGGWWHAASLQALLTEVEQQRETALAQEGLAREREMRIRQHLYAGDMSHAFAAWSNGHASETVQLLERYRADSHPETDLRTFAWYHLWRTSHGEHLALRGHDSDVHGIAWSPDGQKLATASHDGTARIWDAVTGVELATLLEGHTDELNAIAFSPDGSLVATGSDDQVVRLWDAVTGRERAAFAGHEQSVYTVAFSPDGRLVASGGPEAVVRLWDIATTRELATLSGHTGAIESVAFSPDGMQLASASGDHTAILWSLATRQPQLTLRGHENVVRTVAFSPDGRVLATGSDDRTIIFWETIKGEVLTEFTGHDEIVQNVAFSPDGNLLAAAVKAGTVQLWDCQTHRPVRGIMGHTGRIWGVAFSPEGTWLASASGDGTVKIWNTTEDSARVHLGTYAGSVLALSFSSSGERLTAVLATPGANGGEFKTWRFNGRASSAKQSSSTAFQFVEGPIRGSTVFPRGEAVALAGTAFTNRHHSTPQVRRYDVLSGALLATHAGVQAGAGKEFSATCVACSTRQDWLALGSDGGTIHLFHVNDTSRHDTLRGHLDTIHALSFSPDGKRLVSASEDQTVRFWDLDTLAERFASRAHRSGVTAAAFSPDGRMVVTAGCNQTLILWEAATARALATLQAHHAPVKTMTFSHSGKTLATGATDGTLKLWDVFTQREVASWQAHEQSVTATAFSHDDRLLATGGQSLDHRCEIVLWRAD